MKRLAGILTVLLIAAAPAAAQARSGALDRSFGDAGRAVREFPARTTFPPPAELGQAPDGTIYALSDDTLFAFEADGLAKRAFGEGGLIKLPEALTPLRDTDATAGRLFGFDLAVDREGRPVIVTTAEVGTVDYAGRPFQNEALMAVRLLPSGQIDRSFGDGGRVLTDLGLGPATLAGEIPLGVIAVGARSVDIDSADHIVIAASHVTNYVMSRAGFLGSQSEGLAVRLDPSGAVDASYGNNGVAIGFAPEGIGTTALAADGSLYALDPGSRRIVRLDSTGSLDPGFKTGGQRGLQLDEETTLAAAGRRLVVSQSWLGAAESEVRVARLLTDGRRDPGFGRNGIAMVDFHTRMSSTAVAPDGRGGLFLAGGGKPKRPGRSGPVRSFLLLHLDRRGRMDRRYGRQVTGFGPGTYALAQSALVDSDGRPLLIGGIVSPLLPNRLGLAVARYRAP
jgi:uncharacterized delta-60 repeat protein